MVAAQRAGIVHFVYVSVAQPAPLMRAYVAARTQGEALLRASGLAVAVLGRGMCWSRSSLAAAAAARVLDCAGALAIHPRNALTVSDW